ncbi:MAG: hypothetical protein K8R02_10095 [Anaerohalosphaeraceae bacterium]|nr:hypothetical protein [Anaerohalosphaeraceae bacterium]
MKSVYKNIERFSRFIPPALRAFIRSKVSLKEFDLARCIEANPFRDMLKEDYPDSEFCLGIIEDVTQYHKYYIAACRDMKISYRVLDILQNNWVEIFRKSNCNAYLAWPSIMPTSAKEAFDYRLNILEKEMGAIIYPGWKESWLTEHKPRLRDWLEANDIPRPETWVFYDKQQALQFSKNTSFPVVVKTATGASASGISIVRDKSQLNKAIKLAFGRGLRPISFAPNDRQWGYVYIQRYYPNVKEWRMVRIGDSYFGYRKEPDSTGLHSASKNWSWLNPDKELLELTKKVTEKGNFTSMDVDIFLTQDSQFLVNECQTVFGCTTPAIQMKVNDVAGRYLYENGQWKFEKGDFCQNHMCNLRIGYLLSKLHVGGK